jgi:hypothetical protein
MYVPYRTQPLSQNVRYIAHSVFQKSSVYNRQKKYVFFYILLILLINNNNLKPCAIFGTKLRKRLN